MQIYDMKVNHLTRPMGFDTEPLTFSYKVRNAAGKRQTEARIRVWDEKGTILLDTGFDCAIDSLGFGPRLQLRPRHRYCWQVTVHTDAGEEEASPVETFETGKLNETWAGKWIMPAEETGAADVLQKQFEVPQQVVQARLYICGLGLYEAHLNGCRVGDEQMTPCCTNYDAWVQYQTYDVTALLGEHNVLQVELADGWYKGRFGFKSRENTYGDRRVLICELRCSLADGSEMVIASDESWQTLTSKVCFSNIYDGEALDDTLPNTVTGYAVEAAHMRSVRPAERLSPPVRVVERLCPAAVLTTPKGETVLDMGQNMTGRLAFKKPALGHKVHLQFGEVLQEDCFYRDNLRSAKAEFTYVSDGCEGWVSPRFTFFGFRYVKLEGFDTVRPEDFEGEVLCSEMSRTAQIKTGNPLADRFAENVFWGQRGNFLDVPTDCPQRDERMGWTGDAQAFCGTAMYQTDCAAFYAKFMRDMLTEQQNRDGGVPHVVPAFHLVCQPVCAWSDAACIIPWTMYTFYGDRLLLSQQYESMRLWADWIYRLDEKTGGSRLWQAGFHYADWLALDAAHPASCTGGTDRDFIASCYYYYSTLLTAKAAAVLQKEEDRALFAARAEEIRTAIRREYYTASGKPAINTQTACVLLLQLGLADESEKPLLCARLDRLLEDARGELRTGFVGTIWLCRVLAHEGMAGRAVDLFLREEYPGWLYEVKMGATTVWERWNSMLPDGRVSDTGMNSFNHYAYGSVMEWFCRDVAGIAPMEAYPGFRRALMAPHFDPRLSGTSLTFESPCGEYHSAWTIDENNTVHWSVTIPFGAEAEVHLPSGELSGIEAQQTADGWQVLLAAGRYEITLHCDPLPWAPMVLDVPMVSLLKDEKISPLLRDAAPTLETVLMGHETITLRRLRAMSLSALPPQELRAVEQVLNACAFEGSK